MHPNPATPCQATLNFPNSIFTVFTSCLERDVTARTTPNTIKNNPETTSPKDFRNATTAKLAPIFTNSGTSVRSSRSIGRAIATEASSPSQVFEVRWPPQGIEGSVSSAMIPACDRPQRSTRAERRLLNELTLMRHAATA